MTRTLFASLLITLAAGCDQSGIIQLDPVESTEPGTVLPEDDCPGLEDSDGDGSFVDPNHCAPEGTQLDPDDTDADVTSEDGFSSPHQEQEEEYGWYTTFLTFDFVEDNGDIQEPALAVMFTDGTWQYSELGKFDIAPSDPTAIEMVVDRSTMEVLTAEYFVDHSVATMYSEEFNELGPMYPSIGEDGYSVIYYVGADPPG